MMKKNNEDNQYKTNFCKVRLTLSMQFLSISCISCKASSLIWTKNQEKKIHKGVNTVARDSVYIIIFLNDCKCDIYSTQTNKIIENEDKVGRAKVRKKQKGK